MQTSPPTSRRWRRGAPNCGKMPIGVRIVVAMGAAAPERVFVELNPLVGDGHRFQPLFLSNAARPNMRLDRFVSHAAGVSRADARELVRRGRVQVDGIAEKRPAEAFEVVERAKGRAGGGGSAIGGLDLSAVRFGTPLPSLRRLPVERDGAVRWRTTAGVTLLRVAF